MNTNNIAWLRLHLEYGQEPLGIYDSEGNVIDVGLPPQWEDDERLKHTLLELSDAYDELFINNEREFSYIGFHSEEQRAKLQRLIDQFIKAVYEKNHGEYRIRNDLYVPDVI